MGFNLLDQVSFKGLPGYEGLVPGYEGLVPGYEGLVPGYERMRVRGTRG